MKSKKVNIGEPGIKKFKVMELVPADYNPRTIKDENLEGLKNSLARFGCVEPIIINIRGKKNRIVGGHQRHKALLKLGVKEAICVTVDLADKDEKLLNLSLNNPALQGEFIEQLDEYIKNLEGQLDSQDFLDFRIDQLRSELEPKEKEGQIKDDEIPEPPKKTITQPGDLWILGEHRLLCGSSTSEKDVARLMDSKQADLFATDPPYCIDYTGKDRPSKEKKKGGKDWTDVYHEVDIPDATGFYREFYKLGLAVVKKNAALYLWHAHRRIDMINAVAKEMGLLIHQQIIWVKPCVVLTFSVYSWRHEPCLLMWVKGARPAFRRGGREASSVWYAGYSKDGDPTTPEYYTDIWELDWDGKKRNSSIEHPTVKPVEIFAIPMRVHTKPGDICYEPFSGSGTQIIAAEKLSRRCFAMELEPFFCDVAVKRWEEWTGKKAKLESAVKAKK